MNKHRIIGLLVIIALVVITTEFLLNYRKPDIAPSVELSPPEAVQDQAVIVGEPLVMDQVPSQEQEVVPMAVPLVDNAVEDKKLTAVRNEQAWVVQVASYSDQPRADKLVAALKAKLFDAFSYSVKSNGKAYIRVCVGPVATRQNAELVKAELLEKTKLAGFVNPYTPQDEAS